MIAPAPPASAMTESFPYRGKLGPTVLAVLFFGAGAAFFAHRAAAVDRGLHLYGLVHLGPRGAAIFFAVLGVVSALFVVLVVAATICVRITQPVLILGADHVVIPGGRLFKRQAQRIEFAHVTEAFIQKINGQEILILRTPESQASITRSLLHPEAAFDRIAAAVRAGAAEEDRV